MIDYTFPQVIAGEEVLDERQMLKVLERDLYMDSSDSVRFIVVHCTGSRCDRDYTPEQLIRDHKRRGFRTGGYHLYIRKSGEIVQFRRLLEVGAHAKGYNRCSIGISYEGGLVADGEVKSEKLKMKNGVRLVPADTRTPEQKAALLNILGMLHKLFPKALILGHRDLPGVKKACPCFNVTKEYVFRG